MSDLLTTKDVAEMLRITKRGVDCLCNKRLVAYHLVGRERRFIRKDVDKYMQSCRIEAGQTETGEGA